MAILTNQGNADQKSYHLNTCWMTITKKNQKIASVGKDVEKLEILYTVAENV